LKTKYKNYTNPVSNYFFILLFLQMQFTVKITYISELDHVGQKATPKQYIVMEEIKDKYPNKIIIEFMGDKTEQLSHIKLGDTCIVDFNTSVNEYQGRHY
jgi:hypothetical protein